MRIYAQTNTNIVPVFLHRNFCRYIELLVTYNTVGILCFPSRSVSKVI